MSSKPPASQPHPIISTENILTAEEVSTPLSSVTKTLKYTSSVQASKTTTTVQVQEIDASPAVPDKIGSNIGYSEILLVKHLLTVKSLTTTPTVTSSPVITSSPIVELMMSSKPIDDAQQVTPKESTPLSSSLTKHALRSSQTLQIEASPTVSKKEITSTVSSSPKKQIVPSPNKGKTTTSLSAEIKASLVLSREEKSPSVTFSQSKQTLSSETRKETTTSKILTIEASSVIKEEIASSQSVETVMLTSSPTKQTLSSETRKKTTTSKVLTMEASPVIKEEIASSQSVETVMLTSSPTTQTLSSQIRTEMTSSRVFAFVSTAVERHHMTSSSPSKLVTSSQLLTSSEALISSPAKTSTGFEYSSQHLEVLTSLQATSHVMSSPKRSSSQIMAAMLSSQITIKEKNLSISRSSSVEKDMTSSPIATVMTSSKSMNDLPSSQTMKPTAFKEVKIVKSTLILSSSQLADLITTSHPMSMMGMTSSTEAPPLVEEKSTTTLKTPAITKSPKKKTTTSPEANTSAKKTVAMTTSPPKPTVTTEHPAIHTNKPTHHGEPTHHGDKNTTNTTHGGHGPHSTMGYPHEPPVVNAQTEEKEDDGWQISVVVVCSLIIGMVAFVVVFVVKLNREYRLVGFVFH